MAYDKETVAQMRAAGVVQAVIASGADPKEWRIRAAYGKALINWMANRSLGNKVDAPALPKQLGGK